MISLRSWAQETRPLIRFTPFICHGIGAEEIRFIESIIWSYFSDVAELLQHYEDMSPEAFLSMGGLPTDSWGKTPDFVLSGSIYLQRKSRIFTLEIQNTRTDEITGSTTTHTTSGDIALRAKTIVEGLWNRSNQRITVLPVP